MAFNAYALDDFDLFRYGPQANVEVKRTKFIVEMVFYDNPRSLQWEYDKRTTSDELGNSNGIRAFTVSSESIDTCYIHIEKAEFWDDREQMAITGHELYHCMLAKHNKGKKFE